MKAAVALSGRFAWETVSDLSSLMLYDPLGTPIVVGLEYVMPEGTAWTFASEDDDDFHRILGTSGILHTVVPGFRPGTPNLLCTPVLKKGVPRWFDDVDAFVVSTDSGIPFFLAHKTTPALFRTVYYHSAEFKERLQLLWNRRR